MNVNSAQGLDSLEPKKYRMYEIARMCDVNYGSVFKAIRVLGLISTSTEKPKKYDEYQADLIFEYLYFICATDSFILPSKLNGVEFYGQFA